MTKLLDIDIGKQKIDREINKENVIYLYNNFPILVPTWVMSLLALFLSGLDVAMLSEVDLGKLKIDLIDWVNLSKSGV